MALITYFDTITHPQQKSRTLEGKSRTLTTFTHPIIYLLIASSLLGFPQIVKKMIEFRISRKNTIALFDTNLVILQCKV